MMTGIMWTGTGPDKAVGSPLQVPIAADRSIPIGIIQMPTAYYGAMDGGKRMGNGISLMPTALTIENAGT